LLDDIQYTNESYFSIVTETVFYHEETNRPGKDSSLNGIRFGEKIYKPMAYKHPFILLGFTGSLRFLRYFGFKTFHPFINENYDLIDDDNDRMIAIVNEINRLSKLSASEWIEWQNNVKDIVEHNFNMLADKRSINYIRPNLPFN
jgi:hypothetical protein